MLVQGWQQHPWTIILKYPCPTFIRRNISHIRRPMLEGNYEPHLVEETYNWNQFWCERGKSTLRISML